MSEGSRVPANDAGASRTRGGGSDLKVEAETLASFKSRIDKILVDLEESPAAKSKISDQTVAHTAFGAEFTAAADLAGAYEKLHDRLEKFSRTLGDQLEALGIAVQISDRGYESIDAEQADRLRAIQDRTTKYYGHDADNRGDGRNANQARKTDTGKSGTADSNFK
ncbi:hypothetical protein [Streptomyces rapamycinicus]|uniref:Uncharacterized protein n=2 Tax=Streptomyces rapamycinicus TaxID=1226757 RepID=A0A0A0N618_STRRN|nr:hypothetical protein [Streptomyces rapamycinicus]AGP54642.1 hypothetical protein M271_15325 [Streptomyces rapamycinicus NRRL 5491]MBB4782157.1 hypothetical protein [Streptomyces rapamycinicus]RLV82358.1 hypothetical protein D3C57_128275 [Streptomyces rapamycinicus NRRL 5491]UTO62691.1 hypothetical protein LJB45_10445 [Streptomyces rapamycinicus]UTP30648.1 hypothetical protein LIV37_15560 [Streptomyces rapamycinicus NRRL 5491]